MQANHLRWLPARVVHISQMAERIKLFRFFLPSYSRFVNVIPGSFIEVKTPAGLIRQFSLVRCSAESQEIEIAVLQELDSLGGSTSMHQDVELGMTLEISAPFNNFKLVPDKGGIFIGAGVGMSALISMIDEVHRQGLPYEVHDFVRNPLSRGFVDYLDKFKPVYFYQGFEPKYLKEQLTKLLSQVVAKQTEDITHVYFCGPLGMLHILQEVLAEKQWPTIKLHCEVFTNPLDHANEAEFTIGLVKSGKTFHIPPGVSIADVLRENDIKVETSCEQGICGTCYTKVLGGDIIHRDAYLTEDEKQRQDAMMICVSRSCTGGHIDLDL